MWDKLKSLFKDIDGHSKDITLELFEEKESVKTSDENNLYAISEPVISFVRAVREHPEQFKIKRVSRNIDRLPNHKHFHYFKLADVRNRKVYLFYVNSIGIPTNLGVRNISFLNFTEKQYILKNLFVPWLEKRELDILEAMRIKGERERQEYMKIYCKD